MNRSKTLAAAVAALLFGLAATSRATDVTWKKVTYHNATITSVTGDRVTINGTSGADGTESTFEMPISKVPDEIILAYRAAHSQPTAERLPTAQEEAAVKVQLADRKTRLANLKQALAQDPNHPVMVVGHIIMKDADGVVIVCDAGAALDLPQSAGTVFLMDCPGTQKLQQGDPIGVIGYKAGQHIFNAQNIQAYSIHPPKAGNGH